MSRILNAASMAAVGMTTATMLFLAEPGFANDLAADANIPAITLPAQLSAAEEDDADMTSDVQRPVETVIETERDASAERAGSLADLVAATPRPSTMDTELRCLAGAVYFESRGESLAGQLAVARVVINRAESARFPSSLCGVVHQKHQFSFVRGGKMPAVREGKQWANAIAIAQIAREDSWKNNAPGALFFHANYVSPRWRKQRIAQIDNHIFYR